MSGLPTLGVKLTEGPIDHEHGQVIVIDFDLPPWMKNPFGITGHKMRVGFDAQLRAWCEAEWGDEYIWSINPFDDTVWVCHMGPALAFKIAWHGRELRTFVAAA